MEWTPLARAQRSDKRHKRVVISGTAPSGVAAVGRRPWGTIASARPPHCRGNHPWPATRPFTARPSRCRCRAARSVASSCSSGSSGALDRWSCTAGHGLAMTLSESYEQLQEDEIGRLWQLARDAADGPSAEPVRRPADAPLLAAVRRRRGARGRARRRPRHRLGRDRRRRRRTSSSGSTPVSSRSCRSTCPTPSPRPRSWPRSPRSPPSSVPASRPPPTSARPTTSPSSSTAGSPATRAR